MNKQPDAELQVEGTKYCRPSTGMGKAHILANSKAFYIKS
jgi:hypothetical protein